MLDENLEREVYDRLRKIDFVVQHVDEHEKLGKGEDDQTLADYSLTTETLIGTYADDFETHCNESGY